MGPKNYHYKTRITKKLHIMGKHDLLPDQYWQKDESLTEGEMKVELKLHHKLRKAHNKISGQEICEGDKLDENECRDAGCCQFVWLPVSSQLSWLEWIEFNTHTEVSGAPQIPTAA